MNKLDAVIPLLKRDLDRFWILDRSLRQNFRDLNTCWVVTPDREFPEMKSKIPADMYRVIPESKLLPEMAIYRKVYRLLYYWIPLARKILRGRFDAYGWFIQQLVKMAIAERVQTDFYLTLDADVVCVKPVGYEDLVQDGRAIVNVRDEDVHPEWYKGAERVLGLNRSGLTHGVTPALFSRPAMLQLHDFLRGRVHRVLRRLGSLCRPGSTWRSALCDWRGYLLRNTPWTEYTLYHTFLEHAGLFDTYHVRRGGDAIYDNTLSVWQPDEFEALDLDRLLRGQAFFLVVQSNTGIPAAAVWKKLEAVLGE